LKIVLFFDTESYSPGYLKLEVFLPQPPKFWNYRCPPPHPAENNFYSSKRNHIEKQKCSENLKCLTIMLGKIFLIIEAKEEADLNCRPWSSVYSERNSRQNKKSSESELKMKAQDVYCW
jgi:hypothetical protein